MEKIGKYIYGIMNSGEHLFYAEGLFKMYGIGRVYTVSYQDISAVVSDTEMFDCAHILKDVIARRLIGHQKVIEEIMPEHTVIPMRLGMTVSNENEVRDILDKGYNLIKDIFKKIDGKIEIDVVATWSDFVSILKEVGEDKEVKELKVAILSGAKKVTVDDQMKIGLMIKNHMERKREEYALRIQTALNGMGERIKTHELMDEKMVANFAFLIDKQMQEDFYKKIEELNAGFNEKLNFRCVGPLPPYSFYTLEVKKMQFEEIDWARKKLSLNDFATKYEIKKAQQAKALSFHPDRNPDIPETERKFNEAIKAYKILWEYCQGDSCSFIEEDVKKNAILVGVRG